MEKDRFAVVSRSVLGEQERGMMDELTRRKVEHRRKQEGVGLDLTGVGREGLDNTRIAGDGHTSYASGGRTRLADNTLRKLDNTRLSHMNTMMTDDRNDSKLGKDRSKTSKREKDMTNIIDRLDETRRELAELDEINRERVKEAKRAAQKVAREKYTDQITPSKRNGPKMVMEKLDLEGNNFSTHNDDINPMMKSLSRFRKTRNTSLGMSSNRFMPGNDPDLDQLEQLVRQSQMDMETMRSKNQKLKSDYESINQKVENIYTNRKQLARVGGLSTSQLLNTNPAVTFGSENRRGGPPGNIDSLKSMMQNATRNPDLNDFERALAFIEGQEHDSVDMMLNVPVGTDLYRFKAEQFKETSTTRGEIEKLVYEQMLKAMKKGYDIESKEAEKRSENLFWTDEQRKNIIAALVRRQMGQGIEMEFNGPPPKKEEEQPKKKRRKSYDPSEGFIVFWDYVLGLPAKQDFTNFEWAIVCNGDLIRDFEDAKISQNIEEDSTTVYSIISQKNVVKSVQSDPEALIIWKVYMPVSQENQEEITEIGWTQIDIFSINQALKRGIWKCPLYELPVDTHITKEAVQELTPIQNAWFYLRISFPWGDEYTDMSIVPEESAYLAEIPEMHLRVVTWKPERPPVQKPPTPPTPIPQPEEQLPVEPEKKVIETVVNMPEAPQIDPYKNDKLGCILEMKRVLSYTTNNMMKIGMVCFEGLDRIRDDTTMMWIRNTMIHNPFAGALKTAEEFSEGVDINLGGWRDDGLAREGKMANLAKDEKIIYVDQKFNLYKNLPRIWAQNRTHWWIMFQLMERKVETLTEISKRLANIQSHEEAGEEEKRGNPWTTQAYAVFRLSTDDFRLREGIHTIKWFKVRKPDIKIMIPPFDEKKAILAEKPDELQFKILRSFYDMKDVDKEYKAFQKQAKKREADEKKEVYDPSKMDVDIANDPFIVNNKKQWKDMVFEKGWGVDFYLDQCRFLPDNVSITKCVVKVVNNRYKDIFKMKGCLPKFNIPNDALNPIFEFRTEYRSENFNPTSMILIRLITIDKAHNESRVIGYSAINLFLNRYSEEQPTEESDSDIVLQSGAYQIPVYAEEPYQTEPFDLNKMKKLRILPCASVLVRINLAPMSKDFKTVLSRETVPKEDWRKLKVWPKRPEYPLRAYNSSYCEIKDDEKRLFMFRDTRADQPVVEESQILLRVAGINRDFNDKEMFEWLNNTLRITPDTKMLDNKFFAKYISQAGFKFTVDAIHNVDPDSNPYVTTFTLNPPGDYYETGNTELLIFNSEINWKHPKGQILYNDNLFYFKGIAFDPYMHMIIEVKLLKYQSLDDDFKFFEYGWAVVPIFIGDGYVMNGHYQIPLFEGTFPKDELLKELRDRRVWEVLEEKMQGKKPKIKYKGNSSVMVRIIDGQREGQLNTKLDLDSLDQQFLPQKIDLKIKFAYNQQVKNALDTRSKLESTIPNNGKPATFNKKILKSTLKNLDIQTFKT